MNENKGYRVVTTNRRADGSESLAAIWPPLYRPAVSSEVAVARFDEVIAYYVAIKAGKSAPCPSDLVAWPDELLRGGMRMKVVGHDRARGMAHAAQLAVSR